MANESNKASDLGQGVRQKVRHSKVRTGCKTCKQRKVKCDEARPVCRRCITSKVRCDGYEPPKAWIFNPGSSHESAAKSRLRELVPYVEPPISAASGLGARNQSSSTIDPQFEDPAEHGICKSCCPLGDDRGCPTNPKDIFLLGNDVKSNKSLALCTLLQPSGSYRSAGEQYYLKYFLEVAASSVSRSAISSSFWKVVFPQVAWTVPATKDALLSTAITCRHITDYVESDKAAIELNPYGATLQNRAIRSLISDSPPLEAVLIACQGFWLTSMLYGDWARSLQHSYHALKLCAGIVDRRKHDFVVLQYSEWLARSCLGYFRATRGPCPVHPAAPGHQRPDLLVCDASCYIPEEVPREMRIADALCHLGPVAFALSDYRTALLSREVRHSQNDRVADLLEKSLVEVRKLEARWSNFDDLGLNQERMSEARLKVPFTHSPFTPVLRDLNDFIENDEKSGFSFAELELRLRVTMPNFGMSTDRQDPRAMAILKMKSTKAASPGKRTATT
jgi:Fungal Zn(2)-Cys(6) binuclear cluster domain